MVFYEALAGPLTRSAVEVTRRGPDRRRL